MSQNRDEYRVQVDRPGTLRKGEAAFSCAVHDLSRHGVLVAADVAVSIGDRLQLDLELASGMPVRCVIQVKHAEPGRFGAAIVSISPEDEGNIFRFLEQLTELNLLGF